MKRLLIISVLITVCTALLAQSNKSLTFIYIAHDHTTPVDQLCDRLSDVFQTAKYEPEEAVVFYLPNSDEPKIVKMNLPGDNRDEFPDLLGELRYKSAHEIFPEVDIVKIPEIFNSIDFITEYRQPSFAKFNMVYYVTPIFWKLEYNEAIIAHLYFTLDFAKLPKTYFKMQIWHAQDDGLKVNEKMPFGTKDLCEDYNFLLLKY